MENEKQNKESFFPEAIKEELDKAYSIIEGKYYRDVSNGIDAQKRLCTVDIRVEKEKMIKSLKEAYKKKLCRTGFTENSNKNKAIRYVAFEQFEEVVKKLFEEELAQDGVKK